MSRPSPDKSAFRFPVQEERIYLNHCGIAPLHPAAKNAAQEWDEAHMRHGAEVFRRLGDPQQRLHQSAAQLLGVPAEDLSFLRNTAEGLSMIANGLPMKPGERILSYVHEYPSNHYPWRLQQNRGLTLGLLPDRDCGSDLPEDRPRGFLLSDLEKELKKGDVRAVALSQVQFASGFMVDLVEAGRLCKAHGAWLIVDAAQSLGAVELFPAKWGVDAVAASGWKWLLGPVGTGLLYTSAQLRRELACTMAGADLMEQGEDYLNHSWRPHQDGKFFEYSTGSMSQAAALDAVLRNYHLNIGITQIDEECRRLRGRLAEGLDRRYFRPARFPGKDGPILSWLVDDPEGLARRAQQSGVFVTVRGNYLRTAPHYYNTNEEIERAVEKLNAAAAANRAAG